MLILVPKRRSITLQFTVTQHVAILAARKRSPQAFSGGTLQKHISFPVFSQTFLIKVSQRLQGVLVILLTYYFSVII